MTKNKKTTKSKNQKYQQKTNIKAWVIGVLSVAIIITGVVALANFLTSRNNEAKTATFSDGTKAPGFTLTSTQGNISLSDYKGKNVVIYFYEGNG